MDSRILVTTVVQNGNLINCKLCVRTGSIASNKYLTETSEEFVLYGVPEFKFRLVAISSTESVDSLIFVQFNKRQTNDQFPYVIKLTSSGNKCFSNYDGTWHLIFEKNIKKSLKFPLNNPSFEVNVAMEVVPSSSSIASLHEDTEFADFELRGEDGSVHMHRAVLATVSPVLHRLMTGSWREATEGSVDVPGTSQTTLQHLKDYMYLHTLPESGLEHLLLLASYYMITELEQMCVNKMVWNMTASNACDLIEFATVNKMQRLLLAVLDCVQRGKVSVNDMRECN